MASGLIGAIGFGAVFVLLALRIPVGIALGLVGVGGFAVMTGSEPAWMMLRLTVTDTATDLTFGVIPLFVAMGVFARDSGISTELFRAFAVWSGRLRGGVAHATVGSSGAFSAICGSSVATAATMTKIALPELRKQGYEPGYATGAIAAGGTLGILIPPSVALIVYGVLTQNDIGVLFMAGLIPGLLGLLMYMLVVWLIAVLRPQAMPPGARTAWGEKLLAFKSVAAPLGIFVFVIGGIYAGAFTALEAGGVGAGATLLAGTLRRRLNVRTLMAALSESARTAGALFLVIIGALLFGKFIVMTGVPQQLAISLTSLEASPTVLVLIILLALVLLGCVLDALAMMIITVPILYPVVTQLGVDPILFGILVVMASEVGLITPPYGMNAFVVGSVAKDIDITTIFRGLLPFAAVGMVRILVVLFVPALALLLPQTMF